MIDPAVHAALIVVCAWLMNLLFTALKLNIGGDVVNGLAEWFVGYILSLFGYSLYLKVFFNKTLIGGSGYKPPFT